LGKAEAMPSYVRKVCALLRGRFTSEREYKMNNKLSGQYGARLLAGSAVCVALALGCSTSASAVTYTEQEKENMKLVFGLYESSDAAVERGDIQTAIVAFAQKYIAEDYIQHASFDAGNNGRANFIAAVQPGGNAGRGARPGGAGGPSGGGAGGPPGGAGGPPGAGAGGPPGGGAGGPPGAGAGGPPGQQASAPAASNGAAKGRGRAVLAFMANGDYVLRVSSSGNGLIWNLFRAKDGFLAEHWDANGGGSAGAGIPGSFPASAVVGSPTAKQ
jgi:predicted SnoaL-like aldol condensation-catalyzing enzyme